MQLATWNIINTKKLDQFLFVNYCDEMNDIILQINAIKKSFVRNIINMRGEQEDERFYIIDDLDLFIPRGKITALIGGNGAGKTTLFNIVSRLTEAESGDVVFQTNGNPLSLLKMPPFKISRLGIGRLFQDDHIIANMSVLDNMLLADGSDFGETPFISFLKPKAIKSVERKRIEKARNIFMELFVDPNPFWEKRNDPAKSLSYGQQRLLGLARLFMGNYKLVLLDEPTAGVNPQIIRQIMTIIRRMVDEKGVTVFLIEHNMKVVLELADFCSFMSHGKITAFGTPEDVIGNNEVRRTYLGA